MSFLTTCFGPPLHLKSIVGVSTPWGLTQPTWAILHSLKSHLSTTSLRYFRYNITHCPLYSCLQLGRGSQTTRLGRCDGHFRIVSYIPSHFLRDSYAHLVSWFLDNPELNWTPPRDLLDFIAKARSDGKALVYIGFGSITVPNPKLVSERIIRAVLKSKYF